MERLMLWIARNKNTTPKPTVYVVDDVDDDLSSWEIINPSHEEETDDQRPRFIEQDKNEEPVEYDLGNNAMVLFATKFDDPILTVPDPSTLLDQRCRLDEYHQRSRSSDDNDDDDDDDDDDNDDYDYDYDGFGNQRMGKVGKKVNRGMMKKSKKLPRYFYNKMP